MVTKSLGGAPRRATQLALACAATVVAAAVLQGYSADDPAAAAVPAPAPPAQPGPPGQPGPPDGVPAERRALCDLRPEKIRGLRAGLPEASSPESLRDAVWLLEERVEQWRGGAEGLPQAAASVRLAADVEAAWREALTNHDAGNAAASRAALSRADAKLAELDKERTRNPIPGC